MPEAFAITTSAREAWEKWYYAKPRSIHATRLDTIGFRLMGLLAMSMDKADIDDEVIFVVTRLLDYEYQVRQLTDPIDADNKIAALEQKIKNVLEVLNEWVPDRELRQRTHAHRAGLWAYNQAIKNLKQYDEIEADRRGKKDFYRLNPEFVASSVATQSLALNFN